MNAKLGLIFCSILTGLVFLSCAKSKSQTNMNGMTDHKIQSAGGAGLYQKNHQQYKYYIETIGTVSIDQVKLNHGKLTAIYSYRQGSEERHVVSELQLDGDGIYKGTCTTKVNGKILFDVNTWLIFNEDGTALGNWSWSGAPSKNDPTVKISKI